MNIGSLYCNVGKNVIKKCLDDLYQELSKLTESGVVWCGEVWDRLWFLSKVEVSPPASYERRVGLGTVDGERLRFFSKVHNFY